MATRIDRLSAFLARNARLLHHVDIVHVSLDDEERTISTYGIDRLKEFEGHISAAADTFLAECQDNCDAQGGTSRYIIRIMGEDNSVVSSHVVKLEPNDDSRASTLNPKDISAGSAVGAVVRTCEILSQILIASLGTLQRGYQQLIAEQRTEIKEMRQREADIQTSIQRILDAHVAEVTNIEPNHALDRLVELGEDIIPAVAAAVIQGAQNRQSTGQP